MYRGLLLYRVADTLEAYGLLARARRRAITGPVSRSAAPTARPAPRRCAPPCCAPGIGSTPLPANDNNLVGVPKTILAAPPDTEALVIEAGASVPGELGSRPNDHRAQHRGDHQRRGTSHLDGFGSLEGVLEEELELLDGRSARHRRHRTTGAGRAARQRARAGDHRRPRPSRSGAAVGGGWTRPDGQRWPSTGCASRCRCWGSTRRPTRCWRGRWCRSSSSTAVPAAEALRTLRIPAGRGELIEAGGLTIVNDAYNANPASFLAAIATARAMRAGRRLVFVAGTMRELGTEAARHHAAVAAALVGLEPDLLAAVGEFVPGAAALRQPARRPAAHRPGRRGDGAAAQGAARGDELVVLKASRGAALERILPYLTGQDSPDTLRLRALSPARPAGQALHPFQSFSTTSASGPRARRSRRSCSRSSSGRRSSPGSGRRRSAR